MMDVRGLINGKVPGYEHVGRTRMVLSAVRLARYVCTAAKARVLLVLHWIQSPAWSKQYLDHQTLACTASHGKQPQGQAVHAVLLSSGDLPVAGHCCAMHMPRAALMALNAIIAGHAGTDSTTAMHQPCTCHQAMLSRLVQSERGCSRAILPILSRQAGIKG